MLTGLAITASFGEFLAQLANKKEGEPLMHWQEGVDFLIVFIGDGDCRHYILTGWMCPHVDFIVKFDPDTGEPRKGEDPFAGFEMSGGVQGFLQQHYKQLLGDRYEEFSARHNRDRHTYHASELLERWLKEYAATNIPQIERVKAALKSQNPSIHIPL